MVIMSSIFVAHLGQHVKLNTTSAHVSNFKLSHMYFVLCLLTPFHNHKGHTNYVGDMHKLSPPTVKKLTGNTSAYYVPCLLNNILHGCQKRGDRAHGLLSVCRVPHPPERETFEWCGRHASRFSLCVLESKPQTKCLFIGLDAYSVSFFWTVVIFCSFWNFPSIFLGTCFLFWLCQVC